MLAHRRAAFLHPHLGPHPVLHLQKVKLRISSGANRSSVVTGMNRLFSCSHSQLSGDNRFPIQNCTWWYAQYECYFAAPSIGGSAAMSDLTLNTDLVNKLRDVCLAGAPYNFTNILFPTSATDRSKHQQYPTTLQYVS